MAAAAKLGLDTGAKNVCLIGFVPYARLFPLLSVVIHHGGAGTTATSISPTAAITNSGTLVFNSADLAGVSVTITAHDNAQQVYRFVEGTPTDFRVMDVTGKTAANLAAALQVAITTDNGYGFHVKATVDGTTVTVTDDAEGLNGNKPILVQPAGSAAITAGDGTANAVPCSRNSAC